MATQVSKALQQKAEALAELGGLLERVEQLCPVVGIPFDQLWTLQPTAAAQGQAAAPTKAAATATPVATAPAQAHAPAKRGRGRPKGSKNKNGNGRKRGAGGLQTQDGKKMDLPTLLETISQQVGKPLKMADFVTLARQAGYKTDAKDFNNMVYQCLTKLVKRGRFRKDTSDEGIAYQFVGQAAA